MNLISSPFSLLCVRSGAALVVATLCTLTATAGNALADPKSAIKLVSHRAVYELKVSKTSDHSIISGGTGLLVYTIEGDNCTGYSTKLQIVTRFATTNGKVSTVDSRQTAWESPEGDTMQFTSRQYVEGELADEVEGEAEKGSAQRTGRANYTKPEGKMELPAETVFPIEHTKNSIAAAMKGTLVSRTIVFDGSELNKIFRAVTFIGKPRGLDELGLPADVAADEMLQGRKAWPMSFSYFDLDKVSDEKTGEQLPAFAISSIMFENGIATNLKLGYTDFSMTGKLTELEIYKDTSCNE